MNYEQIRSTTAFLVSELQAHVIKPDELVNFRVLEDSGVITPIGAEESSHLNFTGAIALAPDGRKYRFTRAEIQEAYAKITVEAKPKPVPPRAVARRARAKKK